MDICQILGEKGLEKALEYYSEDELKSIIEKLELEEKIKQKESEIKSKK